MPIPTLDGSGLLPEGLHDCTIDEIEEAFGRFVASDRRPRLFRDLRRYFDEACAARAGTHLIVNGSFVTSKPDPNDIDVVLVLRASLNLTAPLLPPFEYNARSRRYVKREYGLDFYPVFEDDEDSMRRMLGVFARVRDRPDALKGILRLAL